MFECAEEFEYKEEAIANMSLVGEAQVMDLPASFLIDYLGSSIRNSSVNAFKLCINNYSSSFIEALQAYDNGAVPPSIPNNVIEPFNSALAIALDQLINNIENSGDQCANIMSVGGFISLLNNVVDFESTKHRFLIEEISPSSSVANTLIGIIPQSCMNNQNFKNCAIAWMKQWISQNTSISSGHSAMLEMNIELIIDIVSISKIINSEFSNAEKTHVLQKLIEDERINVKKIDWQASSDDDKIKHIYKWFRFVHRIRNCRTTLAPYNSVYIIRGHFFSNADGVSEFTQETSISAFDFGGITVKMHWNNVYTEKRY